jgi:hypothetical protein
MSAPFGPLLGEPQRKPKVRYWRIAATERSPKIVPAASAVRGIATIRDRVLFGNNPAQG